MQAYKIYQYPYFTNASGLEYMWAQSMLSSHLQAYSDAGCSPEVLQLIHANQSNFPEVSNYQVGQTFAAY